VLGRVLTVWERAAGPAVAASSRPVAEHDGVLTVECESSVWAQELELMGPEILSSLNAALGSQALSKLRCRTGVAPR
jgi:predicted nucleic acid-binding Zn ribbon protein